MCNGSLRIPPADFRVPRRSPGREEPPLWEVDVEYIDV